MVFSRKTALNVRIVAKWSSISAMRCTLRNVSEWGELPVVLLCGECAVFRPIRPRRVIVVCLVDCVDLLAYFSGKRKNSPTRKKKKREGTLTGFFLSRLMSPDEPVVQVPTKIKLKTKASRPSEISVQIPDDNTSYEGSPSPVKTNETSLSYSPKLVAHQSYGFLLFPRSANN